MIDTSSKNCRLSIYKSDFELIINEEGNIARSCQSAGFQLLMKCNQAFCSDDIFIFPPKSNTLKNDQYIIDKYTKRQRRIMESDLEDLCSKSRFCDIQNQRSLQDSILQQRTNQGELNTLYVQTTVINESLKDSKNLVRVGWSTQYAKSSSSLGGDYDSCGYENSGTRFYAGNFKKYGETYGPGDVIRCCIDLEGQNKSFSFYKNGQFQGIAYRISNKQNDKAYFPSVNIRNAEVQFNFGNIYEELYPIKPENALNVTVTQAGGVLPMQSVQQQPQKQLAYTTIQPHQQPQIQAIHPQIQTAPIAATIPGQYIGQPAVVQNQYINQLAYQPHIAQGAPQQAKQAPYGVYPGVPAYQIQPHIPQHQQQYPQQPYIQQQPQFQEPPKQLSIPNAQNLVSKEEIKISQYSFVSMAQDDVKEHEQVQISEQNEVIFMVGLPASGKTTYAQGYVKKNPDTILLGSFEIFEHIVTNLQIQTLSSNLTLLMEISNHIMEKSMRLIAKLSKRSVLIDQCNVLLKARLKKLNIFKNFVKKAFVLVVSDSDQRKRMLKRERQILNQCQMYPKLCLESFRNLQEHFVMPSKEEGFSEIQYLEIDEEISQRVALMNNLIVVNEVHPLLKPYDFKRVKAIKEAQEKLKLQQLQQPQQPQQMKIPFPQQQQPQAVGQQALPTQQTQNKDTNQTATTGQIQFISQQNTNTTDQKIGQTEASGEMNLEHQNVQTEEPNQQPEEDEELQEENENEQQDNSQGQDEFDQAQQDSEQGQDQWGQNNSNQEEMENQGLDEAQDQTMDDEQQEQ